MDGLGSLVDGSLFSSLKCGNTVTRAQDGSEGPCVKAGTQACSNCRLIYYCSKDCQTKHWSKHRADCKSALIKPDWKPTWVKENRPPAFVGDGPGPLMDQLPFIGPAGGHYVWGNVPAIDLLNVDQNEGQAAVTTDFNLCFAASGDIRNLLQTVNGLPDDYRGRCDILVNDRNPYVVSRNLIVLFALLSDGPSIEQAVEVAVHLLYSSGLTPSMSQYLASLVDRMYGAAFHSFEGFGTLRLETRGSGILGALLSTGGSSLGLEMLRSTYTGSKARLGRRNVMCHPSRVDYLDRHLSRLTGPHRVGFRHFRESGILLPFSADVSHFTEPNRLLHSPNGQWLLQDSSDPLEGWDFRAIRKSALKHKIDTNDAYGCLFFHVKEQLLLFAQRLKDCHVSIHLTDFEASSLSRAISNDILPPFHRGGFDRHVFTVLPGLMSKRSIDRVEATNLIDYVGISQVLDAWGPMVNRQNRHAALLVYSMNWRMRFPDSDVQLFRSMDRSTLERCGDTLGINMQLVTQSWARSNAGISPEFAHFLSAMESFCDNTVLFEEYLRKNDTDRKAAQRGLKRRTSNKIHAKRFGLTLDNPHQTTPNLSKEEYYDLFTLGQADTPVRFVEFQTDGL